MDWSIVLKIRRTTMNKVKEYMATFFGVAALAAVVEAFIIYVAALAAL